MRKLSVNQNCNRDRGFEEDVELTARAGISAMGVHRAKLESIGVDRGARLLRDAGLEVTSYTAAGHFLAEGQRRQAIDDTRRCIETAARLQAGCLTVLSGPRGHLDWEEANRRFQDALAEVLPEAAERGVRLAYEPISPLRLEISYLHLLGETLDVVEQVDSPHFGLLLDIWYHWWQRDFDENVRRGIDKTFLVHVSDHYGDTHSMRDRAPLGEGVMPLKKLLGAIDQAGYDGFYEIEVFSPRFTEEDHATLITRCKAAFERLWE